MKDGTHLWMSDTASYNCLLKAHDWLYRKEAVVSFWRSGQRSLGQNDQLGPVASRLFRCYDLQLIVMSAYLLSNLIIEKCFI